MTSFLNTTVFRTVVVLILSQVLRPGDLESPPGGSVDATASHAIFVVPEPCDHTGLVLQSAGDETLKTEPIARHNGQGKEQQQEQVSQCQQSQEQKGQEAKVEVQVER